MNLLDEISIKASCAREEHAWMHYKSLKYADSKGCCWCHMVIVDGEFRTSERNLTPNKYRMWLEQRRFKNQLELYLKYRAAGVPIIQLGDESPIYADPIDVI